MALKGQQWTARMLVHVFVHKQMYKYANSKLNKDSHCRIACNIEQ